MSVASKGFLDTSRRAYVAATAFNNNFYTYTLNNSAVNDQPVGQLKPVAGATAGNCPAGRILRETGRKLYPGSANPGVTTLLVAVYDNISLLTGSIDPNSPVLLCIAQIPVILYLPVSIRQPD